MIPSYIFVWWYKFDTMKLVRYLWTTPKAIRDQLVRVVSAAFFVPQ